MFERLMLESLVTVAIIIVLLMIISPTFRREIREYFDLNRRYKKSLDSRLNYVRFSKK